MVGPVSFEWLALDGRKRKSLTNQPVVLVITAIQFYPVLKVDQRDFVASFQDAIRKSFPVFESSSPPPPISVHLPGVVIDPSDQYVPSWTFQDVQREWKVILSRDRLGLETRRYAGFEDFKAKLEPVLEALVEHVVPTLGTRIGLRYIDELRPLRAGSDPNQGLDLWANIVRPELLGVAGLPEFSGRVQQSLQQLLLRDKYGLGINITHGIVPGGSLINPPSHASQSSKDRPFYALDIDAFQELERGHEFAVNSKHVLDSLDAFHEAISKIFRWSLKEEFLESLERES